MSEKENDNYDFLLGHIGHKIVITSYPQDLYGPSVSIECETCYEILHTEFLYPERIDPKWNPDHHDYLMGDDL